MVTKLTFKGEKRAKSRPDGDKKRHKKRESTPVEADSVKMVHANGVLTEISDIPKDFLEYGWTVASTGKDLNGPMILCFDRKGQYGMFSFNQESGMIVSADDEIDVAEEAINFVDFVPQTPLFKFEPTQVTQVFVAVDIRNFIKLTQKEQEQPETITRLALKNNEGKYLSLDAETNSLVQTDVLTENAIFNFNAHGSEKGTQFLISVGPLEAKNKLIITDELKFRIIQDSDDLLDDLNAFHIRIQTKNSTMGLSILSSADGTISQATDSVVDFRQTQVNRAVKELMKAGIKVNNSLLAKIKHAVDEGYLNEFLITVKEKVKTDRRA
ncbi:hypothetical protein OGAPHI_004490 [Ogataea philodendri]|uniref:Uncharacterized protein n=2 Tax=Saccharomycotina TaxID=147537 RepID=A0A9P8T508_9ASCO|nr:uncharacterized protein OGAPHI_004490 [Ogataea philodendri]KAH3666301.1 hypothetical protein OGAPHI_004490 [Ogataea philodendri]